ncbi:MAG: glutamine synthetase family protein [Gammaproteobacteria bacterium]
MSGLLSFENLTQRVEQGSIDTVIVAFPDMQGRLMGKRMQAEYFIETAWEETHCCNYLVATDLEMNTVEGYAATSWAAGYGDYVMRPDMTRLRLLPWLEGTAMVLCDLLDHHSHSPVPHSPRAILQHQVERLEKVGFRSAVATELEFFVFHETYDELRQNDYRTMTTSSPYNEDYHIFQTTREEGLMRQIRNGLQGAGIKVENTKGEADAGQAEINVQFSDALQMADNHCLVKNAIKEIAFLNNKSVTFLGKWSHNAAGSSSHIHQSLVSLKGEPVFQDKKAKYGMSATMKHYLAGLLTYADDNTCFLAPYVNSYKRFVAGTFAPTKSVWSLDNRTAGFRIVGADTSNVRVECRIGGSDLNPYLAIAGQIAAGIAGIEQKLELEPESTGDAYQSEQARSIPTNLVAATKALSSSSMLREAFGSEVIDHYVHAANWEQESFERVVTDYEVKRGFEQV